MAQVAVDNRVQNQKNSNLQLGILSRWNNQLYLCVVRTAVVMEYRSSKGGYGQLQQTLRISRGYGPLYFDKCFRQADNLLQWDRQDASRWANDVDSSSKSPNNSPTWQN